MPLNNVKNALYFRLNPNKTVMDFAEVRQALHKPTLPLGGVNFYYGVNDKNVADFTASKSALNSTQHPNRNSLD